MPRILILLVITTVLLSGCTYPPPIQELEFPRTVQPGESARVVWSVEGYDADQPDHVPKLYWGPDGREIAGSITPSTIGEGPVRPTTCGPTEDCARWSGLRFMSHLSPLDEGEHVYYKTVVWMDGEKSQSEWIRLEAMRAHTLLSTRSPPDVFNTLPIKAI